MKLWSILGNSQRLDGGAMFGNAPRAMWEKWIAPDEHNRIPLACRGSRRPRTAEPHHPARDRHRRVLRARAARSLRRGRGPPRAARVARRGGHRAGATSTSSCSRTSTSITPAARSQPWQHGRAPQLVVPDARTWSAPRRGERARHSARARSRVVHPGLARAARPPAAGSSSSTARASASATASRFHRSSGHTPGLLLTEIVGPDDRRRRGPVRRRSDPGPARGCTCRSRWATTAIPSC